VAAASAVKRRLRFLSAEEVVAMHEVLLARYGGRAGGGPRGRSYEGVDAAVQAVKNSYYQTLEELAAAYAVYIVQGDVFADGNKRTGAAAMLTFLEANAAPVRIDAEELAAMMIELQQRAEAGEAVSDLVLGIARTLAARRTGRRGSRRR